MPHQAKLEHYNHLNLVITLAEAAQWYGVDRKTILYAIDAGNLAGRKSAGTWLVSVASLMFFWGRPTPKHTLYHASPQIEKLFPNLG